MAFIATLFWYFSSVGRDGGLTLGSGKELWIKTFVVHCRTGGEYGIITILLGLHIISNIISYTKRLFELVDLFFLCV